MLQLCTRHLIGLFVLISMVYVSKVCANFYRLMLFCLLLYSWVGGLGEAVFLLICDLLNFLDERDLDNGDELLILGMLFFLFIIS